MLRISSTLKGDPLQLSYGKLKTTQIIATHHQLWADRAFNQSAIHKCCEDLHVRFRVDSNYIDGLYSIQWYGLSAMK